MEHKRPTQAQRILEYIEEHGCITSLEAVQELGILRLASRISELRKKGHKIIGERAKVMNRFGEACNVMRYKIKKEGDVNG